MQQLLSDIGTHTLGPWRVLLSPGYPPGLEDHGVSPGKTSSSGLSARITAAASALVDNHFGQGLHACGTSSATTATCRGILVEVTELLMANLSDLGEEELTSALGTLLLSAAASEGGEEVHERGPRAGRGWNLDLEIEELAQGLRQAHGNLGLMMAQRVVDGSADKVVTLHAAHQTSDEGRLLDQPEVIREVPQTVAFTALGTTSKRVSRMAGLGRAKEAADAAQPVPAQRLPPQARRGAASAAAAGTGTGKTGKQATFKSEVAALAPAPPEPNFPPSSSREAAAQHLDLCVDMASPPVILVLGPELHSIPWECVPQGLLGTEFYRSPSLLLSCCLATQRAHLSGGGATPSQPSSVALTAGPTSSNALPSVPSPASLPPLVDLRSTYYLLNPGGDLVDTQRCFEDWFRNLMWKVRRRQGPLSNSEARAQAEDELAQLVRHQC